MRIPMGVVFQINMPRTQQDKVTTINVSLFILEGLYLLSLTLIVMYVEITALMAGCDVM